MTQFPINEGDRPSRLDLDRFATGELVGEERQRVQAWLFGGADRFDHLEQLRVAKQGLPKLDLDAVVARARALAPEATVDDAPDPASEPSGVVPVPHEPSTAGNSLANAIVSGSYEAVPTPAPVERRRTDPFLDRGTRTRTDAATAPAAPDREPPLAALTPEPQIATRTSQPSRTTASRSGPAAMPRGASEPSTVVRPATVGANRPWWALGPIAIAAVVLIAVGVSRWGATPGEVPPPSTDIRGRVGELSAFVVQGADRQPYDGRALGDGDVLAFQVTPGAAGSVVLLSIDGTGAVTVFEPAVGDLPAAIQPAQTPVPLPSTIVLDAAPGPEVFVAVYGRTVTDVREKASAVWRTRGADAVVPWAREQGGDAVVVRRK